ncbi:MAG: hypothetical protein ABII00_05130 [Elusimicrobiota bacterium]
MMRTAPSARRTSLQALWPLRLVMPAVLLLTTSPAWGTILAKLGLDHMIESADLVFVGTVESVETRWTPERTDVFTFVTFADLDILKGSLEAGATTFTLRQTGGTIPDLGTEEVIGSPRFEADQRVLLFVEGNLRRMVPIVGMGQGVFHVIRDTETGTNLMFTSPGGSEVLGFDDDVTARPRPERAVSPARASPGVERDPRARAARLRIEAQRRAKAQALSARPGRAAEDLIRELRERVERRRRDGRLKTPRPARSADPRRDLAPPR